MYNCIYSQSISCRRLLSLFSLSSCINVFVWHNSSRVCNHVIAVYSEKKLKHYATAYRNHKSAGEKLGSSDFVRLLRIFFFFFFFFSANILQPVLKSLFN